MFRYFNPPRRAISAAPVFALLVALAPAAAAQGAPGALPSTAPQTQAQPTQTQPAQPAADKPATQVASSPAGEAVAANASPEPLYREYRGVALGMSAKDVRAKLGKPQEKSDVMDFYVFNDRERARVYYTDGKATAVIATYLGKDATAPAPAKVLGAEIEAKADGSMYRMTPYPQAGYWVAYSRTAGDSPMTIITMQKSR